MAEKEPVAGQESCELEQAIVSHIDVLRKKLNVLTIEQVEKLSPERKRELLVALTSTNLQLEKL